MKKFVIFILCFICMCGLSGCKGSVADSGLNIDGSETLVDVYIEKIIVKESDSTLNIANTYFFRNELYKYRLIEIDSSNVEVCFSDGTVKLLEDAFKTGEVSLEDLKANNIQYAKDYLFSIQDQVKYDYDMFGKEIEVEKKNEVFYEDDEYSYFFDTAKSQYMILKYKNGRTENAVEALQCGKITLEDFNRFDIGYYILAKNIVPGTEKTVANIVNEAALRAVRDGRKFATQADLEESIEVVIAGYQKKNAILTDKEKMIVAYHEIGHALVAAKQSNSAPVQKITIVPRTSGALGYTMQVDEGNHYLMSKEEIENKIATYTGGRVAEEIAVGSISTGASNDIEQATKLARAMITRYGMSDEFGMVALETITNQYLGGDASLACSAETQTEIDRQVIELVKKQYEKAKEIITENKPKLDELAQHLYMNETITGDEFMGILNS